MKWNRQTATTVVIVFATIVFTSFILKFTMGLETVLITRDDGYLIDPQVVVVRDTDERA